MKYRIDKNAFFSDLQARGITTLFHANSLETSLSFFRVGAMLSRQECTGQSLPQSSQWSDKLDKQHNVFDDIFLNFSDFHRIFKTVNNYGPILFEIKVEALKEYLETDASKFVHITKSQPHRWKATTSDEDKWRQDLQGVFLHPASNSLRAFVNGWPDIVLSGLGSSGLPFSVLSRVVIDENPNNRGFFQQVKAAFDSCLKGLEIELTVVARNCSLKQCGCRSWATVQKSSNEYKYQSGNWSTHFGKIA